MAKRNTATTRAENKRAPAANAPPVSQTPPDEARRQVPNSACAGIVWPAMPGRENALLLAMQMQLEQSQWWSPGIIERMQWQQLKTLISHAAQTVPFYNGRLDAVAEAGNGSGEFPWDAWLGVPILQRADIQDSNEALVSRASPPEHGKVVYTRTSGSTGRAITVKRNSVTRLFFQALSLRYHVWHKRDFSGRVAGILVADPSREEVEPAGQDYAWVPGYASGPMLRFNTIRPLDEQLAWLETQDPDYLVTYPTNLHALLRRCEGSGLRLPRLRGVSTVGEVLDPEVREACERIWGVPLSDGYGAMELGFIALQCPDHAHYHVQSESVLVEVLDDDGKPCRPGELGRVIITDLHNFTMPLIRYEIGDYAEIGEACPCGRGLPVLNRIVGRTRNMLVLPSGDRIWPQFGISRFANIAPVRQGQVVQTSLDTLEVRLVTARPLVADEERRLTDMILEFTGFRFNVVFSYHDEIPRSQSGKYEDFRSEVAAP